MMALQQGKPLLRGFLCLALSCLVSAGAVQVRAQQALEDFAEIPAFLASLKLDYRFYLRCATIFGAETVLFAEPGPEAPASSASKTA